MFLQVLDLLISVRRRVPCENLYLYGNPSRLCSTVEASHAEMQSMPVAAGSSGITILAEPSICTEHCQFHHGGSCPPAVCL